MKKIFNIVLLLMFISAIFYVIYMVINFKKMETDVNNNGVLTYGIIYDQFIGRMTVRRFTYSYVFKENEYIFDRDVEEGYFNKHKIGDTILIKLIPDSPDKNIIMEKEEYKSCMGLPPEEGWKKLARCE